MNASLRHQVAELFSLIDVNDPVGLLNHNPRSTAQISSDIGKLRNLLRDIPEAIKRESSGIIDVNICTDPLKRSAFENGFMLAMMYGQDAKMPFAYAENIGATEAWEQGKAIAIAGPQ